MAQDPRFNFVVRCPATQTREQSKSEQRKDFFDGVGKLGDIEVANALGAGAVTEGLRTLAKTSDAIRGGASSAIIANGVTGDQAGANVVLEKVGINSQQAEKAGQFNPGVLNRATAEAESIYDRVTQGEYHYTDIPNSFQSLQNLATLTEGIFTDGATDANRVELCGATPYARALISYAPKFKFLFIVQVTLKEEYADWKQVANSMAFVVKNTGRPNINVEHEEVNMYNFWTRVPKRTVYEPVTMRFYDDTQNQSHIFYNAYLNAISPIARLGGIENGGGGMLTHRALEDAGMNGSRRYENSSASLGALEGDNTSIIDEIRVFHLFNYGRMMTVYNYKNPKILAMNLDDLDMSEGTTGNEVELQFAYDALHITPEISVRSHETLVRGISGEDIGITDLNIRPVFGETAAYNDTDGGLPPTKEEGLLDSFAGAVDDATAALNDAADNAFSAISGFVGSSIDSAQEAGGGLVDDYLS